MQYGLITQIGLIIISAVIVFSYIQPTLGQIGQLQDEALEYGEAVDRATEFNQRLQQLVSEIENTPAGQIQKLETFMPDTVDRIDVVSDIETIARESNVRVTSIDLGDGGEFTAAQSDDPATDFDPLAPEAAAADTNAQGVYREDVSVSLLGRYRAFVDFLSLTEQNAYPLDVVDLAVSPTDGSIYSFEVTFRTYALTANEESSN